MGKIVQQDISLVDVLTVKDLAVYLKVSRGWVYANIDTVPHRRIGNMFRFSKKAIDEWLSQDRDVVTKIPVIPIMDSTR